MLDQTKQMQNRGYTMTVIGILLNTSQSCVSGSLRIIRGRAYHISLKSGTPRIASRRHDITIKNYSNNIQQPFHRKFMQSHQNPVKISSRTIRRRLFLKEWAHKSHLSNNNIKDRLNVCMKYKDWSPQH